MQLSLPKKQKQSSLKPPQRLLLLLRMPLLLKELPSKKSSAKKGDQLILVHSDTHAHVQNDIWVFEIGEDLDFFHEIISAFVGSTGLDVIFDSNWT